MLLVSLLRSRASLLHWPPGDAAIGGRLVLTAILGPYLRLSQGVIYLQRKIARSLATLVSTDAHFANATVL